MNDGRPYFDVSASGNWDKDGRELVGTCRILPGQTYCMAAIFDSASRISLIANGQAVGSLLADVPVRLHANDTPVLLGAQPPGKRWADVAIVQLDVDCRVLSAREIETWTQSLKLTALPTLVEAPVTDGWMDLSIVRQQVLVFTGWTTTWIKRRAGGVEACRRRVATSRCWAEPPTFGPSTSTTSAASPILSK